MVISVFTLSIRVLSAAFTFMARKITSARPLERDANTSIPSLLTTRTQVLGAGSSVSGTKGRNTILWSKALCVLVVRCSKFTRFMIRNTAERTAGERHESHQRQREDAEILWLNVLGYCCIAAHFVANHIHSVSPLLEIDYAG